MVSTTPFIGRLNEVKDFNGNSLIYEELLNEQLLYESFVDTITDYIINVPDKIISTISDWKDAALVFAKIMTDERSFNKVLIGVDHAVESLLQKFYQFLTKSFPEFTQSVKDLMSRIRKLPNWKQFLLLTGIGVSLTYLLKLPTNGIIDYLKNKFLSLFSPENIINEVANWKNYIGWLGTIGTGIEIVYQFLQPFLNFDFINKIQLKRKIDYVKPKYSNQTPISDYDIRKVLRQRLIEYANSK